MKRVPVIPTIVVAIAIVAMIALGFWQLLIRLPEKEAYLAQLAANPTKPVIAFPTAPDDRLLFRRTKAMCLEPISIEKAGAGNAGFRLIADCRTGAEGPGVKVQLGTTRDPTFTSNWHGGAVTGWISHAPDATPLIGQIFRRTPQAMLLVADTPAPGLAANTQPDIGIVPNNHFAYAWQWFFFATVAAVIYTLAVRKRLRAHAAGSATQG